ncbi:MAG: hypothetical protein HZB16_15200 [Armatimonadetes bacterium]|nr:hypothetical protein [Armatimonadota bacterium]
METPEPTVSRPSRGRWLLRLLALVWLAALAGGTRWWLRQPCVATRVLAVARLDDETTVSLLRADFVNRFGRYRDDEEDQVVLRVDRRTSLYHFRHEFVVAGGHYFSDNPLDVRVAQRSVYRWRIWVVNPRPSRSHESPFVGAEAHAVLAAYDGGSGRFVNAQGFVVPGRMALAEQCRWQFGMEHDSTWNPVDDGLEMGDLPSWATPTGGAVVLRWQGR